MTQPSEQPESNLPKSAIPYSEEACAQFQAGMAARIEAGEDLQGHPHMLDCERCNALVRDLEAIAEAARELIPIEIEPDEDLWTKIEKKLALGGDAFDALPEESIRCEIAAEGGLTLEGGVA